MPRNRCLQPLLLGIAGWVIALSLMERQCAAQQLDGVGGTGDDQVWIGADVPPEPVRDPLQAVNRLTYHLNDRLYFWVMKPVVAGYGKMTPAPVRRSIRNIFHNLGSPRRAVNCLLQGKFQGMADEWSRFLLNSTIGMLGCRDIASDFFKIREWNEDFGQTLGFYGVGYGIYLNWPLVGPSNPRDTIGFLGNVLLDPLHYLVESVPCWMVAKGVRQINKTSLHPGKYEKNRELALDYYIWIRETFTQYRTNLIKE
jgi:phospholipid-binding lipoprotein MlaA